MVKDAEGKWLENKDKKQKLNCQKYFVNFSPWGPLRWDITIRNIDIDIDVWHVTSQGMLISQLSVAGSSL